MFVLPFFTDIENKAVEVVPRLHKKSESSTITQEHCSSKFEGIHDTKQVHHDSTDESSVDSKKIGTASPVNVAVLDNQEQKQSTETSDVSQTVLRYPVDCSVLGQGSNGAVAKRSGGQRPESRFDPETLALIREIGSALLNSPAKSELEEDEDVDLKEGESLVKHFVRKIENNLDINTARSRKRRIVIIDKDSGGSDKTHSFSPVIPTSPKSDSEFKTVTSKWSPVAGKQTFSPVSSPDSKSRAQTADDKHGLSKHVPSSCPKFSDCDDKPAADANTTERSDQKVSAKLPISSEQKVEHDAEVQEVCSVKNLRGKFELPDVGSSKVTHVQSSSLSTPTSAKSEQSFDLGSPGSGNGTLKGQVEGETKGHFGSRSPVQQHHSEPVIALNPESLKLFEGKLREMGSSIYTKDSAVPETLETEPEVTLRGKGETQQTGARPKSASNLSGQGRPGQRISSSLGAKSGRGFLQQSKSLLEGEKEEQQFTWEGKKVRKSYGKSHPLAKLENRQYLESGRKNPFYNTM